MSELEITKLEIIWRIECLRYAVDTYKLNTTESDYNIFINDIYRFNLRPEDTYKQILELVKQFLQENGFDKKLEL